MRAAEMASVGSQAGPRKRGFSIIDRRLNSCLLLFHTSESAASAGPQSFGNPDKKVMKL